MKRAASLAVVLCAFGQSTRDAYRSAYREWRVADPVLERDASAPAAELAVRASIVAGKAAQYGSARAAFLLQMSAAQSRTLAWLETPPDAPSAMILDSASALMAAESKSVKRAMETFAADPDPGIRELRVMLARENTAIDGLTAAIEKRRRAAEAVKNANGSVAESQRKAADHVRTVDADAKRALDQSGQESLEWAQYYTLLAKATPAVPAAPPPGPITTTAVTPLPLIRYTGDWGFPPTGGLYHGPQPESFELQVQEENGHATGTLVARFKLPAGSNLDPELRFSFTGEFKNTRNQQFHLTTAEGASGTIELIPGPAFNLLEVNFETEPKPRKVRQANVVLLKR